MAKHFIVNDKVAHEGEFKALGYGSASWLDKDRGEQASKVNRMYEEAMWYAIESRKALNIDNQYKASGNYIEMKVNEGCINIESLNTRGGAKLMNIKSGGDDTITATLFLPNKNAGWLRTKLAKYRNPEKDNKRKQRPANGRLINSIETIDPSSVLNLFTIPSDKDKYEKYPDDYTVRCELWIDNNDEDFNQTEVFGRLDALQIEHSKQCCRFEGVVVVLIKGAKSKLNNLVFSIDNLSELRLFKEASVLLSQGLTEQKDWVELIEGGTEFQEAKARVGIIDSGVNNKHPLLNRALPDARCYNATLAGLSDKRDHGTLLAGLALYGDLTDVIYNKGKTVVNTDLVSVKILPGENESPNDKELYGVIMEDAISQARKDGAHIQCSAVTADNGDMAGEPSSWSSAIDETLFNGGAADTVLFISAGNIKNTGGEPYPDFNIHAEIEDPAQSWNAVTVGAYTEKAVIGDSSKYAGRTPIAREGGLSPYSRTSMMLGNKLVKPEILMEGGNAIEEEGVVSPAPDDLMLVSTSALFAVDKYFDAIYATSAATALAARLAAKIKCEYLQLSALSIRALMVHSAEWTEAMKNMFKDEGGINIHALLHTCGYGVPVEEKALASSDCYATFISEQTLTPLVQGDNNKYKMGVMHLFDLPWPKEVLEQMGEEWVRLKITLSYYVQPAPGSKTRQNKYKYPSLGLRFDVSLPTESEDQFIRRVSHIEKDGVEKTKNDSSRWGIGIQKRNQGSVMSDYIVSTAAEIASCNKIAVFPATGWWKDKKYRDDKDKKDNKSIKYSLVVSIETKKTEIYNAIAQKIAIEV
ncbi:MAG: S8 family peptidase [Bacteroidales bacterium]|nr:S8 family peptidase [Bacteroidales bacterium]